MTRYRFKGLKDKRILDYLRKRPSQTGKKSSELVSIRVATKNSLAQKVQSASNHCVVYSASLRLYFPATLCTVATLAILAVRLAFHGRWISLLFKVKQNS